LAVAGDSEHFNLAGLYDRIYLQPLQHHLRLPLLWQQILLHPCLSKHRRDQKETVSKNNPSPQAEMCSKKQTIRRTELVAVAAALAAAAALPAARAAAVPALGAPEAVGVLVRLDTA
jgi:hypothetical protein